MNLKDIKITPIVDTLRLQKISDEEYFSVKYNGYISNSRLGLIDPRNEGTPEKFFAGLGSNKIYSESLLFGSAVHELSLQKSLFEIVPTVNRTTAKLGFVHDLLYKSWLNGEISPDVVIKASDEVNYYKGKMTPERISDVINRGQPYWEQRRKHEETNPEKTPIYLDSKNRDRLTEVINALEGNNDIQNLLHPKGILEDPISENEQAILLDVNVEVPEYDSFVFRLKAKLDNYTIDPETNEICVNDVKTIGKVLSEFNCPDGNFYKYGYYRELSLYCWLLSLAANKFYGLKNPTITSNCLVVSTIPAYYTKVYKVKKSDFNKGWNEFLWLLRLAAKYYAKGYRFT